MKTHIKKTLTINIIMFLITLITLVGVSFAYFESTNRGKQNEFEIGDFVIESENTLTSQAGAFKFKAPTIINFPKITRPPTLDKGSMTDKEYAAALQAYISTPEYIAALNNFNQQGDDEYFNQMCLPLQVTIINKAQTDVNVRVDIRGASLTDADGKSFDLSGGILGFTFSNIDSSVTNYSEKLYELTKDLNEGDPGFTAGDAAYPYSKEFYDTKYKLKNAQDAVFEAMPSLAAASQLSDGTFVYSRITVSAVCWLDYRVYQHALKDMNRTERFSQIIINLQVSAQQVQE